MKKKNEWFDTHIDANGKNWLQINGDFIQLSPTKKIEVKIRNHEKRLTGRYDQIRSDQVSDSAEIILNFVSSKSADEHVNEKEEIKYYLASEPKNAEELEKFENQAHQKYIIDNGLIGESDKQGENIKWTIRREGDGQVKLEITNQDDPSAGNKIIKSDQLKVKANFFLVDKVTLGDVTNYFPSKKEKPPLTTGWIIFFVFLASILVLIAVFWKKIWRWIKGERAQEKKVREQIDIF